MNELIKEDSSLLLTITRFGFSLGFGDKTISEVCTSNRVDVYTFLAVVNFVSDNYNDEDINPQQISIDSVVVYLKNAHHFAAWDDNPIWFFSNNEYQYGYIIRWSLWIRGRATVVLPSG